MRRRAGADIFCAETLLFDIQVLLRRLLRLQFNQSRRTLMKKLLVAIPFLVGGIGNAAAACSSPYMNGPAVTSLLSGNTVCSPASCSGSSCQWQEQHKSGSVLADYKKGPSDRIDPTKDVGNWSVASNGKVTYTYTGGGSYVYDVHNNGADYSFCGPNGEFNFRVTAGITGC
jgi:hypothetical protein